MRYIFLLALALLEAILLYGFIGANFALNAINIEIAVVTAWLIAWLFNIRLAIFWAVAMGAILDIVGFGFFGLNILKLMLTVGLIFFLKGKYLSVSSFLHSVISLVLSCVLIILLDQLINGSFDIIKLLFSSLYSSILGLILYYFLAIRFKFFQKWAGSAI